ncbi:hypothetical protein [Fictibacillus phosphorivorans]|uniref:hypothetical protein n=1 Tax=Fictibacillus phosphorivorans TaxID=1221500 RepID=UPI0011A6603C|nr:hypothetical protein [Fictibacillus phosphorivorans]
MKSLNAQLYCNLKSYLGRSDSWNISIDHEGNLIVLTSTKEGSMYHHDLYHLKNDSTIHIKIPALKMTILTSAQPVGDNYLLVEALMEDEENDPRNAYVINKEGNILNKYAFGDGVQDVQTTTEGDVWVSYFDQSDAGRLNCFNNGNKTFDFYYSIREKNRHVPPIDDCYAMNVTPDCTNIYYYSDFPFLKIKGENQFELFEDIPIQGCSAFAIHGYDVLFSQDYDAKPEVYLYALQEEKKITFKTLKPDGSILNYYQAAGRGTKLFLIEDTEVYLLDINHVKNFFL